jgi:hypothetical protein
VGYKTREPLKSASFEIRISSFVPPSKKFRMGSMHIEPKPSDVAVGPKTTTRQALPQRVVSTTTVDSTESTQSPSKSIEQMHFTTRLRSDRVSTHWPLASPNQPFRMRFRWSRAVRMVPSLKVSLKALCDVDCLRTILF